MYINYAYKHYVYISLYKSLFYNKKCRISAASERFTPVFRLYNYSMYIFMCILICLYRYMYIHNIARAASFL